MKIFNLFLLYMVEVHRNNSFRLHNSSKTFGGLAVPESVREECLR